MIADIETIAKSIETLVERIETLEKLEIVNSNRLEMLEKKYDPEFVLKVKQSKRVTCTPEEREFLDEMKKKGINFSTVSVGIYSSDLETSLDKKRFF